MNENDNTANASDAAPRHALPQTKGKADHAPAGPPRSSSDAEPDDGPVVVGSTDHPLWEPIINAIQQVYDPEIPVNIYELGLIYRVDIDDDKNVKVQMTLTSPACPAAQELPLQVRGGISVVPEVKDVEVDITFDPPWGPEKMSEVARVTLGMM